MDINCIQCGKTFGKVKSSLDNGNASGSICIDCFIEYLERRVNFLKLKEQTIATTRSLQRNKKRLTLMLIERQERS